MMYESIIGHLVVPLLQVAGQSIVIDHAGEAGPIAPPEASHTRSHQDRLVVCVVLGRLDVGKGKPAGRVSFACGNLAPAHIAMHRTSIEDEASSHQEALQSV